MLDGEHQAGQRATPQRRCQAVNGQRKAPNALSKKCPVTSRAARPTAASPATTMLTGAVRGAAMTATQTAAAATTTSARPAPARCAARNRPWCCTPSPVIGTAAACAAATINRASSATSQTAPAAASGAVARPMISPRYRSSSSIGTTASPRQTTAAQSATARTSVTASELCGYARAHAATDAAATTSAPPASAA